MKRYFDQIWNSATQRVMSVTTIGMALALLADMLLAARLGTSVGADVIIIALTLPRLLEVVIREGTRHSMIALYMEVYKSGPLSEYRTFTSGMFNLLLVIGILLVALCMVFAAPIVAISGPGLSPEAKLYATTLFRLAMPLVLFVLLEVTLGVALNCERYFSIVASRNSVVSATVVLLMVFSWRSDRFSEAVTLGYTVGNAVYALVLLLFSRNRTEFRIRIRAWPEKRLYPKIWRSIAYPTAGYSLRQGARMVERMLATLAGPGAVSAYYFAYRLFSAAQTIIGVSFVTTAAPALAAFGVTNRREALARFLRKQIVRTVLLTIPISVAVIVLSNPIVNLIYGRGQFDAASVIVSSQVLGILFIGFVFACIVPLLSSAVYGMGKLREAFFFIAQASIVHVLSAVLLSTWLGLPGLALAASLPRVYNSAIITRYLQKQNIPLLSVRSG